MNTNTNTNTVRVVDTEYDSNGDMWLTVVYGPLHTDADPNATADSIRAALEAALDVALGR